MSIGKAKAHESAELHVSGRAVYTDDLPTVRHALTAYPVTATEAHARISKLDVAGAMRVPGVVTVLTHHDVPGENDSSGHHHDEVLLPVDTVMYHGQALAWVLAESEEAAVAGAAAVEVELTPLPAILTLEDAIAQQSFHGEAQRLARGDAEAALAEAELTLAGELYMNGQEHFYLESHASLATVDSEGNVHVYSSTQHPTETQQVIAKVLGVSDNRVVVTCLRMGGGFGGKESQANPWAALAALGAYKTGRAVRVHLRRHHDMTLSGKRHPFLGCYRVGFDRSGKLLALKVRLYSDGGWSTDLSPPVMSRALFHVDNAYYLPHLEAEGWVCKTHKTSQTAFRGFGGPQGMLVVEEVIDRVARHLGLLPEVVRERNFYHGSGETATTHYGQELIDIRIGRCWHEVKREADFDARRREIQAHNEAHPYRKRGLAITPVKFGISFTNTPMNQAGALVLIYTDGSIQLNHGGTEMGQGLHTKMLQVAASTLGVGLERFRMMPTATDKVPNTSPTAASSGSDLNGQAVKDACETLRARLASVAARMLGFDTPQALRFEDDWIFDPGEPQRRVAFTEVVKRAHQERVNLSATGFYRTPNLHFDKQRGRGRPFYYFAYGAAASEVEVDGLTGAWTLRRVDIVHDVGDPLNPLVDLGQIEGGFVQGMGWLTMEELVWDERGVLRTFAPSTYKIPTIAEIPEAFNVRLLGDAHQPGVIGGSKAVGEPPLMLAISVREALRDAVAAFAPTPPKEVFLAAPATPEAILAAVARVRQQAADKPLVLGD